MGGSLLTEMLSERRQNEETLGSCCSLNPLLFQSGGSAGGEEESCNPKEDFDWNSHLFYLLKVQEKV